MGKLDGKIAIVTGAAQGIGAGIARRFAAEGALVIATDVNEQEGARCTESIRSGGGNAHFVKMDVSHREDVEETVSRIARDFGPPSVLVNNAGVAVFNEPMATTQEAWNRCMAIDLEGAWNCARSALPHMLDAGWGAIVNIASNHSQRVIKDTFPYPVAKHGVIGLTQALALQYADRGITVNAISPGFIDTPIADWYFDQQPDPAQARRETEAKQPVGRLGTPEDIAGAAAFLASDDARFIVGANLVIDGGVTIRMYE